MDEQRHIAIIAGELGLRGEQVQATVSLLDEEATIPFIARYRKEKTGALDEVAIAAIRDRIGQLRELDKRRAAILASLEERHLLTDELRDQINAAETMTRLEDLYLPYRPKRRTRATVAREKGLEPLARTLFEQGGIDVLAEATAYVDAEKEVATPEDALAGARDIIAEWVNEDQNARAVIRGLFEKKGFIRSRVVEGKEEEGVKYRDYYAWEEPIATAPSHRVLAMRRGEKEGYLSLTLAPPEDEALALLEALFVKGHHASAEQVRLAAHDSYRRLLSLSMETEIRTVSKEKADIEAIRVFSDNLRELLLSPPLGGRNILAVDPGLRTGCKVVCLNRQGALLHNETVYPHTGERQRETAGQRIVALCKDYEIESIAVGNGTAGRETERFIRSLTLPGAPMMVLVNESGASVYSASDVARKEFPDHDVTVRGAVSIGRRLMDPLAELVKIDPKAIGVGQYQHDVDQTALKKSLDDVVMSCVNSVGVEVNTASAELISYVSGLGPSLASNIVGYRNEHGPFKSRDDLTRVPRLGPRAFQQAAGFLRIRDGENVLDSSAVHPESYPVVEQMSRDLGCSIAELMKSPSIRERIDLDRYVSESAGLLTLTDILAELGRPGRDPREQFEAVQFAEDIHTMDDLKPGMRLNGVVTNVTNFGAFVDIGVHQDGLVHVSQIADRYVRHPSDVVKPGKKVVVTVTAIDLPRQRIALSMRLNPADTEKRPPSDQAVADKKQNRPEKEHAGKPENRKAQQASQEKKKQPHPGKASGPTLNDLLKLNKSRL